MDGQIYSPRNKDQSTNEEQDEVVFLNQVILTEVAQESKEYKFRMQMIPIKNDVEEFQFDTMAANPFVEVILKVVEDDFTEVPIGTCTLNLVDLLLLKKSQMKKPQNTDQLWQLDWYNL